MAFQTSWAITLNTLRERSPAAVELLKLFAFFAPDAIPVPMLALRPPRRPARAPRRPRRRADQLGHRAAPADRVHRRTPRLPGLPGRRPGRRDRADARLYHRFLRSDMTEDERDLMSARACRVLVTADPQNPADTRYWERYAELSRIWSRPVSSTAPGPRPSSCC